jgi:predicted RNA-binding Zn-ribbon protein involved in translation (DUF1610 family)
MAGDEQVDDGTQIVLESLMAEQGARIKQLRRAVDSGGDEVKCPECGSDDVKATPNRGVTPTYECNSCGHKFDEKELD